MATPAEPAPFTTTLEDSFIFSGYFHSINDSGKNYDSSSVLVIMKYRNIQQFFQSFFDFKTSLEH